jgi:hypothetical protein
MKRLTILGSFCTFAGIYIVQNFTENAKMIIMAAILCAVILDEFVLSRFYSGAPKR